MNISLKLESKLRTSAAVDRVGNIGCSELGFWLIVDVLPGRMSWLDVEVELRRRVVIGGRVFLVGLRICFSLDSAPNRQIQASYTQKPS